MNCGEFSGVVAELALGVLTGRDRAEALAHADACGECRETLRRLTLTGEELPLLLPGAEPTVGFELRVLDRLGLEVPPPGGTGGRAAPPLKGIARGAKPPLRTMALAAAAVTLAILAGLGGWGLRSLGDRPPPPLSSAPLVSAGHGDVGRAYYYAGSPRWMYMRVDGMESGNGTVTCQVREAGGSFITVSSFRVTGGYGSWGSPVPEVSGPVTGARLLGSGGRVLATTRFLCKLRNVGSDIAVSVTVGDAMLLEPTVHPAGLTVAQARDAFDASAKRHMLLLVRDGFLLGTLTRDDIAGVSGGRALDLASLDGRTVSPDASLASTHETMCQRGVRRLAVTDGRGRLLGLLCLKRSRRGFCTDDGVAALRAERRS